MDFTEKLLQAAEQFALLESEKLPQGLDEEQVFSLLNLQTKQSRGLMHIINSLIDENLNAVFDDPMQLSDEDADTLARFAERLYSLNKSLDRGLAYPLQLALLRRAEARRDVDRTVRHLYWTGLIEMQWEGWLLIDRAVGHFERAAAYRDRYFDTENSETRMYINRALGNVYVSKSNYRNLEQDYDPQRFFDAVDTALGFWNNEAVRARDPDFPWDAFIANSHQNTSSFLDQLRGARRNDRRLAERVYESITYLYSQESFFNAPENHFWTNSRVAYGVMAARFHAGLIDIDALLDFLLKMVEEVRFGDYSEEAVYRMMHTAGAYINYLIEFKEDMDGDEKKRRTDTVVNLVSEYIKNIPNGYDRHHTNTMLSGFTAACLVGSDRKNYTETILRLTSYSHLPTYVHSVMVGRLMVIIADYFIARAPKRLVGVAGTKTKEDVVRNRAVVLEEVRLAGLAHDVGKSVYINTVALASRRITDTEFALISLHPTRGKDFFENCPDSRCVTDVVEGHHKWYDGSRGYPASFDNTKSPYRFVIDIASVADSIDAATDSVGRGYAKGKTLAAVADEIFAEAGTRYSPVIAEALRDPVLYEQIEWEITEGRKRAYYEAYLDISARPDADASVG